jgi:hypothetical protein
MRERFQFLNLSDPGLPVSSAEPKAKTTGPESSVFFTIPYDPDDAEQDTKSQDRDLRICEKIAEGLRAEGLQVSKAARLKPWGAGTHTELARFELMLWLVAKRRLTRVDCYVSTHARPHNPSQYFTTQWVRARAAMQKVIRRDLNADSLQWMTETNRRIMRKMKVLRRPVV